MKRFFLLTLLMVVSVPVALSQSTTVTLQVTDAGAQSWNNGSYSVVLKSQQGATNFGPPFNLVGGGTVPNQTQSGTLSATGGASLTLTPNASVLPSQSGWQFSVCPQQGIPTQCFVQTVTIFGASQTVTLTPPTISVNCGPGVNAYADSEVSCSLGGQYYNVTTPTQRQCTASTGTVCNTWTAVGGSSSPKGTTDAGSSTIYLWDPKYNFPGTSQWTCAAGISNGSNIVTTPGTERPFTGNPVRNAVIGDSIWASNAQCGGENSVQVPSIYIALGTITSVDSAHQVHVSNNATATCTVVAQDGCVFVWGPDATASVQAAWVDAGNACGTLVLPAGGIMLHTPPNNTTAVCPGPAAGNDTGSGLTVKGQGPYATMLLMRPDTTFGNVMFQDPLSNQRRTYHDFGVASFVTAPAGAAGTSGFTCFFQCEFYNVWFLNYFPSTSVNFTALTCAGVTNAITECHNNIFLNSGEQSVILGADGVLFYNNQIQNATNCMLVNNGGTVRMHDNVIALCNSQNALTLAAGTTLYSNNDRFNDANAAATVLNISGTFIATNDQINGAGTGTAINCTSGAICNFGGESTTISIGASAGPALNNSAGTVILRNTALSASSGVGLANGATGTVTVKDGNTFLNGITNAAGGVFNGQDGNGVYTGACTGVVTSATTVGLYGLGQFTATTCTSTTVSIGRVMSKPGSVYGLYCTATAGNQAADACTVVKNGVAQTMTCSLNAVTNCFDGATGHVVTFVAGDILGIEVIAGTATTLAGVKGTLVTN